MGAASRPCGWHPSGAKRAPHGHGVSVFDTDNKTKAMTTKAPRQRSPNWFGTLQGEYTQDVFDSYVKDANYVQAQLEKGASGNIHVQFCMQFESKQSLSTVKKLFAPHQPHLEIWRDLSTNYCNKLETRYGWSYTRGKIRRERERTDLHTAAEIAVSQGIRAVHREMPMTAIKYHKGLMTHVMMLDPGKRYFPLEVIVHYGKSRMGKTRVIPDGAGKVRIDSDRKAWFDDCIDREIVYIDEYRGQLLISEFLQITDNYAHGMRIMGGFYPRKYTKMYITCNVHPDEWYQYEHADVVQAMKNRLKIIEFTEEQTGSPVLPPSADQSVDHPGHTQDEEVSHPPSPTHDDFVVCINKRRPKPRRCEATEAEDRVPPVPVGPVGQ